jgi:hypothetical protein
MDDRDSGKDWANRSQIRFCSKLLVREKLGVSRRRSEFGTLTRLYRQFQLGVYASRRSFHGGSVRLQIGAILVLMSVACRPFSPPVHSTPLLLTAAPQDEGVFLTWSRLAGASYFVLWGVAGQPRVSRSYAGDRSTLAITGLSNSVKYEFQIEAHGVDGQVEVSPVVGASPKPRQTCRTLNADGLLDPPLRFFCAKRDLDAWLMRSGIDPRSLKCRGRPVDAWNDDSPDCFYTTADGQNLLLLRSADDQFSTRGYLTPDLTRRIARMAIWGAFDPFFRDNPAPGVWRDIDPPLTGKVHGFAGAQSFIIESDHGLASRVTSFIPARRTERRWAIYHEGHGGAGVEEGADTIEWLLDRGWQVVAMDMPLIGLNREDARSGMMSHADLSALDAGAISPLENFLLPVKAVVDRIVASSPRHDADILLIGRSGGGWTAYTYAALDPRVDVVVSIAGGRPISQRLDAPWRALELGDYEQADPSLYNLTGHEDLMAAAGSIGAFYVFNMHDPCCFQVKPRDPFIDYLRGAAAVTGKRIGVFVDVQHNQHSLGPGGYREVGRFLDRLYLDNLLSGSMPRVW